MQLESVLVLPNDQGKTFLLRDTIHYAHQMSSFREVVSSFPARGQAPLQTVNMRMVISHSPLHANPSK